MSKQWAYCDPCGRWFYPDRHGGSARRTPLCPVCSTEALATADEPLTPPLARPAPA